jgi:large subunit ribosomal protein L13|tara:strand:- start:435 stop:896 length:462 start_codon:yes stop_codon:yes gene_type:complete
MNIKTTFEGIDASERNWHLVDASGLPIGRLASEIAQILRGKHKPQYAPHLDVGDHIVVINASKIAITSKKPEQKMYHSHSGFPGGIKSESFNSLRQRKPEKIIERAVWGMLPKNRLGRSILKKLHIYANSDHPHESQNPQELIFNIKKVESNG